MTREIAFETNWKDKLTAYNGTAISYDAIGNPLNDGAWGYTWEKGRQLKRMSKSGVTVDFAYNADGLRIQKTVNGAVTDYILHGKNVVHLTSGSNSLHFFYDAQNRPAVVDFNGVRYAYILNLQGDVLGLRDSAGTEVVKYAYDAWGKILSTTGSLAATLGKLNPFRYRGYVYDEETGLYYLRSRYYNPTWDRFVNADELFDKNLFAYCDNSPVFSHDKGGHAASFGFSRMGIGNIFETQHFGAGGSPVYSSFSTEYAWTVQNYDTEMSVGASTNNATDLSGLYFFIQELTSPPSLAHMGIAGGMKFVAAKLLTLGVGAAGVFGFFAVLPLAVTLGFSGEIIGTVVEDDLRADEKLGGKRETQPSMDIVRNGIAGGVSVAIPYFEVKNLKLLKKLPHRLLKITVNFLIKHGIPSDSEE